MLGDRAALQVHYCSDAYTRDMADFLDRSELTERRAFIESSVWEVVVMPDQAVLRYTMPMPDDSATPGKVTEGVAVDGSSLPAIRVED